MQLYILYILFILQIYLKQNTLISERNQIGYHYGWNSKWPETFRKTYDISLENVHLYQNKISKRLYHISSKETFVKSKMKKFLICFVSTKL